MKKLGLKGVQAKKFKRTTDSNHGKPVPPDLINQDFTTEAPNQKWVSDLTYIWTGEGWLYLAVIMGLYSRAIIGWSMGRRMTQQQKCDALTMALIHRGFPRGVILHSDRGSQYCSKAYQELIKVMGLRCSMERRATCYDNAAMESFFHTLKVELIHRQKGRYSNTSRCTIIAKENILLLGIKLQYSLNQNVLIWVSRKMEEDQAKAFAASHGERTRGLVVPSRRRSVVLSESER